MGMLHNLFEEQFNEKIENLDKEQLKGFDENAIHKLIDGIVNEASKILDQSLMDTIDKQIEEEENLVTEYNERLLKQWGKAFKLSKALTLISIESVEIFFQDNQQEGFEEKAKVYNLQRLHARACRISDEILCLLKSGYPDAGLARWRTLYELAVISSFLMMNNNDLSERYIDYAVIESYKDMIAYNEHIKSKSADRFSEDEMKIAKRQYDELVGRYGNQFKKLYGWTASVIDQKDKRNFKGIEEIVSLDHIRPYYKWACNKTHGGANGNENHLGLMDGHDYILYGASNYGFADVGQYTAFALNVVTANLLAYRPNIDSLVAIKIMNYFVDRISDEYYSIQKSIEFEMS